LEKSIDELAKDIERTKTRLSQQDFLSKAPQEIVEAQRKRFEENSAKLETLRSRVDMLSRARS
jgi:valyl-tRNA synthetase